MGSRWFSVLIVLTYLAISIYRGGGNPFFRNKSRQGTARRTFLSLFGHAGDSSSCWPHLDLRFLCDLCSAHTLSALDYKTLRIIQMNYIKKDSGLQDKLSKAHVQDFLRETLLWFLTSLPVVHVIF